MNLQEETKQFIDKSVKRFYYKAIEAGAEVSEVEHIGANMYKISVGNMELTYMGTVEGAANVIGASGDVFDYNLMDFKELFHMLNFKIITKEGFSKRLLGYYNDKNIGFADIRDNLNEYVEEDLHETLAEIEEELLNDKVWSIPVIIGNEEDNEGYEDCYLYIYYSLIDENQIKITNIELI